MKQNLGDNPESGNLLLGGPGVNREGGAGRVTGGGSVLRNGASRPTSVLSLGGRRGGSYSPGDGGGRGYDREK